MNDSANVDFPAEYLALKAANDRLRERGKEWISSLINRICAELEAGLVVKGDPRPLQIGRQEWQFQLENSLMIGERIGVRHNSQTLTVEIGWPRLPEHGFIADGGLARGRISLSQNVMVDARPIAELTLNKLGDAESQWRILANKKPGDILTESSLRQFIMLVIE